MKQKAIMIKCHGEAHSPEVAGNIDHCGVCMPFWGEYPTCPKCGKRTTPKGMCYICRKYYKVG